jgi:hypothetical protein
LYIIPYKPVDLHTGKSGSAVLEFSARLSGTSQRIYQNQSDNITEINRIFDPMTIEKAEKLHGQGI